MQNESDLLKNTKLYEYAKMGMELSLTNICQELGIEKYLSKNHFLRQEFSLTTPFSDYDNLEVFLETLDDIKDITQNELLHKNDRRLYSIMENIDSLINTATVLKDEIKDIDNIEYNNDELEME